MATTTNLGLVTTSSSENFNTDNVKNNFEKIDTALGNLANLSTDNKDSLVDAINEQNVKLKIKSDEITGETNDVGILLIWNIPISEKIVVCAHDTSNNGNIVFPFVANGSYWVFKVVLNSDSSSAVTNKEVTIKYYYV